MLFAGTGFLVYQDRMEAGPFILLTGVVLGYLLRTVRTSRSLTYETAASCPMHAFSDLATVAYCPRTLYYRLRAGDRDTHTAVRERRALAFRYPELAAPGTDLSTAPVGVTPTQYHTNLGCVRELSA